MRPNRHPGPRIPGRASRWRGRVHGSHERSRPWAFGRRHGGEATANLFTVLSWGGLAVLADIGVIWPVLERNTADRSTRAAVFWRVLTVR